MAAAVEDQYMQDDGLNFTELDRIASKYDAVDFDDPSNPFVLKAFYTKIFPWKQLFQWLNRGMVPGKSFTHREFAFTLQNDAYLRYNSFSDYSEMKKEVLRLNPSRFEIGPVYTAKPKDRRTLQKASFRPIERELVLDVDMDDYNSLRTCCDGKSVCQRCWKFIAIAVRILDSVLENEFGFQHRLWVFSGRRGIHCWISDTEAMNLKDEDRRTLVNYLDLIKGGANQDRKVNLPRPLHPMIDQRLKYIKEKFQKVVVEDQDSFRSEERWESLLRSFNDKAKVQLLNKACKDKNASSHKKWETVEEIFDKSGKGSYELEDIQIQYTWPRIDSEVSKHLNHLLKSPFVVHPATGKVCVPVNPDKVEEFNPETVPTLGLLLRELEAASKLNPPKPGREWEVTSLARYVEPFQNYCKEIMKTTIRERKGEAGLKELEASWAGDDNM